MKVYLHLADPGLVLADLSLRIYDEDGEVVSTTGLGLALSPLTSGTDYVLDGVPDVPSLHSGLTLTFEQPSGTYHAYRLGISDSQPAAIVTPIREVVADPITDLGIEVFQDGVEVDLGSLTISQLTMDGEYLISGWDHPSVSGEQWSVRWNYGGQVYAVQWVGNAAPASSSSSSGLDLAAIIRQGIGIAHTLTTSLQCTIKHYPWIGIINHRPNHVTTPVELLALVEMKQETKLQTSTGKLVTTKAKLTILQPITPNGAAGRVEPIDNRDRIVLPDGTTGPIFKPEGLLDPKTGTGSPPNPFLIELWLGA